MALQETVFVTPARPRMSLHSFALGLYRSPGVARRPLSSVGMNGDRLEENWTRNLPPGVAIQLKVGDELAWTTSPSAGDCSAVMVGGGVEEGSPAARGAAGAMIAMSAIRAKRVER